MSLSDTIISDLKGKIKKSNSFVFLGGDRKSIAKFKVTPLLESFPLLETELDSKIVLKLQSLGLGENITLIERLLPKVPLKGKEITTDDVKVLENLKRFVLCQHEEGYLLFNKEKREVYEKDTELVLDQLSPDAKKEVLKGKIPAHLVYDAYNIEPNWVVSDDILDWMYLNTYQPPAWQKANLPVKGELPELFERMFANLVPDEEERHVVMSWLHNALTERCHTFLSLRGARGNGKTTFMHVAMAVIGNAILARDGLGKDSFNADLRGKRIVALDDDTFIGTMEGDKLRKRLANEFVTYRAMFKLSDKSERQTASFMIASNDEDSFHVNYDERRIVCVELTKDKATNFMTSDEIGFLNDLAGQDAESFTREQLEFLAELGTYILHYNKVREPWKKAEPYLGGVFWEDVITSLPVFKRLAVEMCSEEDREEITYLDVKDAYEDSRSSGSRALSELNFLKFMRKFEIRGEKLYLEEKDGVFKLRESKTEVDEDFDI